MRPSKAQPKNGERPVRGELLTMTQASKKSGMSVKWIYDRMERGTLPFPWFFLSPGKRMMDSTDIDDWLRSVKIPAGRLPEKI